jgi:hypothetical protein
MFQDTDIIEQIDRDVKRTHPDMPFFCGDSQLAKSNQVVPLFLLKLTRLCNRSLFLVTNLLI